ncbi:MAG: PEP-CTERM sorting domain-containing protein [Opitutaceae bacterium]
MKKLLIPTLAILAAPAMYGAVEVLYSGLADMAGIDTIDHDGVEVFTETVDASGITGLDSESLRLADFSTGNKPEAWWDIANPIAEGEGFRLDLSAAIVGISAYTEDINLRFGNNNTSRPTSSARTFTTVSFEQDGSLKPDGSTVATFVEGTAFALSFVINTNQTQGFEYTIGGSTRIMAPSSIDTWVDGVLVDTDEALSIGGSIVLADGINEIGFTGSSNAAAPMESIFDDITVYTGSDAGTTVPEPSTGLIFVSALAAVGFCRRRK